MTFDLFTSPTSDLPSLLMLSASAGTGKTFAITELATQWLVENDEDPAHVLMVTFTRLAARELKAKLRLRVEEWLNDQAIFRGEKERPAGTSEAPALAAVRARLGSDEVDRRLARLLGQLDGVSARTIHSFVASMGLREANEGASSVDLVQRANAEELTYQLSENPDAMATVLAPKVSKKGNFSTASLASRMKDLADRLSRAVDAISSAGGVSHRAVQLRKADDGVGATVARLVKGATERLHEIRDHERILTFDGIVSDFVALLEKSPLEFATRLRSQFGFVLIDEFQDTDQVQWRIFNTLFRNTSYGEPTTMVVVGDPKQAIYAFRGGDVAVFRALEEEIKAMAPDEGQILSLDTNRRSTPDVVAGYNGLFTVGARHGWNFASRTDEFAALPYQPVKAAKEGPGLFEIRHTQAPMGESQEIIAADIVREVRRQIDRGVKPEEIAVLASRSDRLYPVARALRRSGILSVNVRGASVYDSVAADQIRMLLWMLEEPTNPRRTGAVDALWFDESDLSAWSLLLAERGFPALHRALFSSGTVTQLLRRPSGERDYTDLEHLCEVLDTHFPRPTSPLEIRRWLELRHEENEGRSGDVEEQRRIESDAHAVQLTTVHASKGLEWRAVFIADLAKGLHPISLSTWTTSTSRVINVPSIAGEVDADNEVADDYQMDEMRRQIYVALTRGIETVIAWCPQGESERPWIQLVDHVLASDAEAYKREWAKADEEAAGPPLAFPRVTTVAPFKAEDPDEQLVRRTLALPSYRPAPVVRAAWRRWSYSQLGIADLVAGAVDADDILMAFDGGSGAEDHEFQGENFLDPGFKAFGELRGDNFGDAVHLTFQALLDGSDVTPANVRRQWELVSRRKGVPDGENRVAPALERLLVHPLGGPLTSRTLTDFVGGPSVHHASEMRFTLPLEAGRGVDRLGVVAALARDLDPDGPFAPFFAELTNAPAEQSRLAQGFLTGSLDLVLDVSTSEQPRFVIVDYKTNGLRTQRSYRPADLAVEMARSGYPMQALLYAVALYRYLSGRLGVDVASAAVGPVLYFYLRGALTATSPDDGLMWWDIPQDLIQAISHEFAEGVSA